MKKFTFSVIGFAFLVCAFSANAAALGEPCIADVDCDDSVYCNGIESCSSEGSICVAGPGDPCEEGEICNEDTNTCDVAPGCAEDADCDDSLFCNGVETCVEGQCAAGTNPCTGETQECIEEGTGTCVECIEDLDCVDSGTPFCSDSLECVECLEDLDCVDNGTPFCSDSLECVECLADIDCLDNETPFCGDMLECVECLEDIDCAEGQLCDLGVCADEAACGLFIKPPVLNLKKGVKPLKQMFTIKGIQGEEGFDPASEEIDFGPCEIVESFVAGNSNVLKVRIIVPDNATFEGEFLDVQVGTCTGQVFLKKSENNAALEKQERKEQQEEQREQERLEQQERKEQQEEQREQERLEQQEEKENQKEQREQEKIEKQVEKENQKEQKNKGKK